jgi:hypothetical protein
VLGTSGVEQPPQLPEINVQMFGKTFLRFVLTDDQGRSWTGSGWNPRSGAALLYFHLELAQQGRRKLRRKRRRKS